MTSKKIALLTALAGYGHMSASLAMNYWLTQWGYFSEVYNLGPAGNEEFNKLLYKTPKAYKSFYSLSNYRNVSSVAVRSYSKLMETRLSNMVPSYEKYDASISAYPLIHPQRTKNNIMMLLDPLVHASYLANPYMDHYLLFWEESFKYLAKHKATQYNATYTGPLIRKGFYDLGRSLNSAGPALKKQAKQELGINPDVKLCLITAGGNWIYKTRDYIDLIDKHFDASAYKFAFVCGKDTEFYEEMSMEYKGNQKFIFLNWLVEEEMAKWMMAADFALCFSIAQILVELGLMKVPVYLFNFIEGQEEGYRDVIRNNEIGIELEGTKKEKVMAFKHFAQNYDYASLNGALEEWQKKLLGVPDRMKKTLEEIL